MDSLISQFSELAKQEQLNTKSGDDFIDDVLCYALFPQVGLNFIKNRTNPEAFEPAPSAPSQTRNTDENTYTVKVNDTEYVVEVTPSGDISKLHLKQSEATTAPKLPSVTPTTSTNTVDVKAPLAGNVIKTIGSIGDDVAKGDTLVVLEAMKMETNICAPQAGTIVSIAIKAGDTVNVGHILIQLA
jgi:oxaloacetate decarboxylase alpha subunit